VTEAGVTAGSEEDDFSAADHRMGIDAGHDLG
jgi:hypothetical protein